MRILIHGLNFAPEMIGIGKYTGELAGYLAERGHEVRVVTTPPYYPQWRIADGYSAWGYQKETWQGVEVYRCPLWIPVKSSGLGRILYLLSFAISSLPVMLYMIGWRPSLVFNIAPAILSSPIAALTARMAGSRSWVHIQDFELDVAFGMDMLPVFRKFSHLFGRIETWLINHFDLISTISKRMRERLWEKKVPKEKTVLLLNWVDVNEIFPLQEKNSFRTDLEIPPSVTVVLYSGNMGEKQGLSLLIDAAKQLREDPGIFFLLCGEGVARRRLEIEAKGSPNLRFIPLQPPERLNELLNAADIHILMQRSDVADLVMPSKLGGMFASGKPVIATAWKDTELADVISQVGLVVPPDDPVMLVQRIRELTQDEGLRQTLGQNGRRFVETEWAKDEVLAQVARQIEQLVNQ